MSHCSFDCWSGHVLALRLPRILPIVEWLPAYSWQEHGVKERCCELAAPDLTVTASQNVPEGGRLLAQIASKLAREDSGKTE